MEEYPYTIMLYPRVIIKMRIGQVRRNKFELVNDIGKIVWIHTIEGAAITPQQFLEKLIMIASLKITRRRKRVYINEVLNKNEEEVQNFILECSDKTLAALWMHAWLILTSGVGDGDWDMYYSNLRDVITQI